MSEAKLRVRYTLEFKLEAFRLVKGSICRDCQDTRHRQTYPGELGQAANQKPT